MLSFQHQIMVKTLHWMFYYTKRKRGGKPTPGDEYYLDVNKTSVPVGYKASSEYSDSKKSIGVIANVTWKAYVDGEDPDVEYYLDVDKIAITIGYQASSEYGEDERNINISSNVTWKAKADGDKTDFESMLDNFQDILPHRVTENSDTWNYLSAAYDTAENEWNSGTLGLFDPDNFQEVYKGTDYRGSNAQYEETAHTAMHAWLMAACLSELVPTSGTTDNRQSKLFKKAYELAGGRSTPLYGGFTIKGDPMVARLVAGAIYAYNRHNYSFSNIDAMRNEVGGSPIDITTSWEDLTEVYKMGYKSETNIGYDFAANDIFPSAAGPYSEDYTRKETLHPSEQTDGQPSNLFYPASGNEQVWYNRNYKIDIAVDNEVIAHYCLNAIDSYLERTVLAVADDSEKPKHRFGNKTYYTCGPAVSGKGLRDSFVPATPTTSGAKYFDGVFSETVTGVDLSDLITDASGNYTMFKKFFDMLRHGSIARQQLYEHLLGRRRPSQGTKEKTARSMSDYRLCWLDDESIYAIDGGGTKRNEDGSSSDWYVDVNGNGRWEKNDEPVSGKVYSGTATDLFPTQIPSTTYPSGHSAGVWVTALFLIQMLPSRVKQIFKAAYSYSVSRTIVRAHWNSDIIYGRTIGTMMPPLLNAVRDTSNPSNDFREIYSQIYSIVTGESPGPGPGPGPEPTPGENQIAIVITNNMTKDAIFNGYLRFTVSGASSGDFCFRKNRYYPYTQDAQWWTYHEENKKKVPYNGYMFGANTEKLTPGQSLTIIYTKRMENHSGSYVSAGQNISDLFGLYFKQTTSGNKANIKLSISIDRSSDQPRRIDQYPNYYEMYFVDKNGRRVIGDQKIVSKGVYYLSIEKGEYSADWNYNWSVIPYSHYTNIDELQSNEATVTY